MPRLQSLDEGFVCCSRRRLTSTIFEVVLMTEVATQDDQRLVLQTKIKLAGLMVFHPMSIFPRGTYPMLITTSTGWHEWATFERGGYV